MITVEETENLGCRFSKSGTYLMMYNYLQASEYLVLASNPVSILFYNTMDYSFYYDVVASAIYDGSSSDSSSSHDKYTEF